MGGPGSGQHGRGVKLPNRRFSPGWLQRSDKRYLIPRSMVTASRAIEADLGGELSKLEASFVERYVHIEWLCGSLEEKARSGSEEFDLQAYCVSVDRLVRIGQALGLQRRRQIMPELHEYLANAESPAAAPPRRSPSPKARQKASKRRFKAT